MARDFENMREAEWRRATAAVSALLRTSKLSVLHAGVAYINRRTREDCQPHCEKAIEEDRNSACLRHLADAKILEYAVLLALVGVK